MKHPDKTRPEDLGPPDRISTVIPGIENGQTWLAWQTKASTRTDYPADRGTWLLYCPGAHAFWSYWALSLVALNDGPGLPPAQKHFPEATHEILILALNPLEEWSATWLKVVNLKPGEERPSLSFLHPFDLVHQFQVPSDDHAKHLMLRIVDRCLRGDVSPDVDCARFWREFIDDAARVYRLT